MASAEEGNPIKSRPSREFSYLKFVNRARVPVDIIWRGFNGEHIRYVSRLAPQCQLDVNTFVMHPWQAWNSDTLNVVNVGGGSVFYPSKWNEQDPRTVVYIDEPVYALVRLCLEKIKSLINIEDADKLDLPKLLEEELKKRRLVEVRDYQRR